MKLLLLILLSFTLASQLQSQQKLIEELSSYYQTIHGTSENIPFDDLVMRLMENPVLLNQYSEKQLQQSELFTPFQAYNLIRYREKYGAFLTIHELASIPGISQQYIEIIAPLLNLKDRETPERKKHTKIMTLSDLGINLPYREGFQKKDNQLPEYPGSKIATTQRLKIRNSRFDAALTYDKDPGEFAFRRYQPEHLTGYLQYASSKFVRQLIAGNFKVHRGSGVVNGSGFFSGGGDLNNGGFRPVYGRPTATSAEFNYLQGVYISLGRGSVVVDGFASTKPEDMSLFKYSKGEDLYDRIREAGYHRTKMERNGMNLGISNQFGTSVNIIRSKWNAGVAMDFGSMTLSEVGIDSVGVTVRPKSNKATASAYAISFGKSHELMFEAAMDREMNYAGAICGKIILNQAISCILSFHRIMPGFMAFSPSGQWDQQNIEGVRTGAVITPGNDLRIMVNSYLTKAADPIIQIESVNWEIHNLVRINWKPDEKNQFDLRVKRKSVQYFDESNELKQGKNQLSISYRFLPVPPLTFDCRIFRTVNGSLIGLPGLSKQKKATALYQQITFKPTRAFSLKYRFLAFNIPVWENRIYIYEPGLRYSFSFKAWQGSGTQNVIIISLKTGKRLTMRAKSGLTKYYHTHNLGSGNDKVMGNKNLQLELQLQLNLR